MYICTYVRALIHKSIRTYALAHTHSPWPSGSSRNFPLHHHRLRDAQRPPLPRPVRHRARHRLAMGGTSEDKMECTSSKYPHPHSAADPDTHPHLQPRRHPPLIPQFSFKFTPSSSPQLLPPLPCSTPHIPPPQGAEARKAEHAENARRYGRARSSGFQREQDPDGQHDDQTEDTFDFEVFALRTWTDIYPHLHSRSDFCL